MKRFLLFAGDNYYPAGGMYDYRGDFSTIEDALEARAPQWDWYHIVDHSTMKIVREG